MTRFFLVIIFWTATFPLRADADGLIRGRVTDSCGAPVEGATVVLVRGIAGIPGVVVGEAKSGPTGRFRLSHPEPAPSSIRINHYLVARAKTLLGLEIVRNPSAVQCVVLSAPVSVEGTIRGEDGQAISGATLKCAKLVRNVFLGSEEVDCKTLSCVLNIVPATTDLQGHFTVTGLPTGWHPSLKVSAKGYQPLFTDPMQAMSSQQTIVLKGADDTQAHGAVRGKVLVEGTNEPLAGAILGMVKPAENEDGEPLLACTGTDGSFLFEDVPPGQYVVFAVEAEKPIPSEDIEVFSGETAILTMYAREGVPISGQVVDKKTGKGVHNALAIVPGTRPVEADARGHFVVKTLPGQTQVTAFDRKGVYSPSSRRVDVSDNGAGGIVLRLSRATLVKGRVTDPDGKPCNGTAVCVLYSMRPGEVVYTDSNGFFVLPLDENGLKLGKPIHILSCDIASGLGAVAQLTPSVGRDLEVNLNLKPTKVLHGTVRSDEGKPIPGARITVLVNVGEYQVRSLCNSVRTTDLGEFVLRDLIADLDYCLRVEAEGFSPLYMAGLPRDDAVLVLKADTKRTDSPKAQ